MPAVGLTDHGSLAGAVQLVKETGKVGVKPIIGCEVYVAEDRKAQAKGYAHLTLLAADNAGYSNLIKLSSLGYLEGYYYKPRVDWELLQQHIDGADRALRLPLREGLQGARGEPRERRGRGARPARADLRQGLRLRRDAERRARRAGADQPGARARRRDRRAAARRDRRRPLPAPRGRARARGAALHPVGRLAQEPEPLEVRHRPVLLQVACGDGARLSRLRARDGAHARDRRALHRHDRAREHPAARVPDARRARLVRLSRRALRQRAPAALRQGHARAAGAAEVRAQDDPRDGLLGLLPDRLGLHPLRAPERDLRRPRPRQRSGLARRLLPRDHGHRPDPLRPALRALPQPGPQVDARHGHRLRRRGTRPRDQLRRREVRARPRRADHHLRDDGGARGRARRRPRARDPLRHRRPDREDDPGGAGADARGVAEERPAAQGVVRRRPDHARGGRSRAAARGADAAGLDPRRRRRDRRAAVDGGRAAAAEGARPGGRDAVRDVGRRGARPAQDGLPRPAQPRRDRQGVRADREPRHREDPARRLEDLRDAAEGRRDRRLPVRVVGHARGAAPGEADGFRRPDRARRAVSPGADGLHPRLREAEERPGAGLVHRPAPRRRSRARRTGSASTRSSTSRSRSGSPASRPPRPTTCARRSARRSTR